MGEPGTNSRAGRIILLTAVAARVAIFVYAEANPARFDYPDSRRYVRVARHIAAGQGPVDSPDVKAGTDPLYPAILSIGVRLGAESDAAVMRFGRGVNVVAGVLAVWLLMMLAQSLVGGSAALSAGVLLAVDPILLFFHGLALTEICAIPLLLFALMGISRISGPRGLGWAAISGICLGLLALLRSSTAPLALILALLAWWHAEGTGLRRTGRTLGLLIAAALTVSPTLARSYRLFGHWTVIRTGHGASLLEGLGPWADGGPGMDRIIYPPLPSDVSEYERDSILRAEALRWAGKHPTDALRLAGRKFARMWSPSVNAPGYESAGYQAIGWLTTAPELLLAIAGMWLLRRRLKVLLLLLAPVAYLTLLHMIFVGSVRYRVPLIPLLSVPAGAAAARVWRRFDYKVAE